MSSLLLLKSSALSQSFPIRIVINLNDSSGNQALRNCYVKVFQLSKKVITNYFNSDTCSTVIIKEKIYTKDTFLFTFSHIGYKPLQYQLPVDTIMGDYSFSALLIPSTGTLEEIVLKGSPVWQKGDTTFYRVDAFKNGTERKLIDIIENLPSFTISSEGKLLFKNKPVSKITIDHEQLMADKVDLLVNSFPLHVLENIEVIENELENKVLKGLEAGSQTVVNLKIKKNKLQAAFGDAELGLGTLKQYLIKGTQFGLKKKLKIAAIFNNNNIGNGLTPQGKNELLSSSLNIFNQGKMNQVSLAQINRFEQRFYIENKQFDNRIQINNKINNNLPLTTEIIFISDNQTQSLNGSTNFISDTNVLTKLNENSNVIVPKLFKITQRIHFFTADSTSLKFSYSLFNENQKTKNDENFRIFNNSSFKFIDQQSQTRDFTFNAELSKKNSQKKATVLNIDFSLLSLRQLSNTSSPIVGIMYATSNSQFDQSMIKLNQKASLLNISSQHFRLKNKTSLHYLYLKPQYNTEVQLQQSQKTIPDSLLESLSGKEQLATHQLFIEHRKTFRFLLPITTTFKAGIANISRYQNQTFLPLYALSLGYKSKHTNKKKFEISSSFNNNISNLNELRTNVFPQEADGFVRYENFENSIQNFDLISFYSYRISKKLGHVFGFVSYRHQFQSALNNVVVNSFSANNTFSLVQRPTRSGAATVQYLFKKLIISFNINTLTSFFINGGAVVKSNITSNTTNIKFNHNWNKKLFIEANSSYNKNIYSVKTNRDKMLPKSSIWDNSLKVLYSKNLFRWEVRSNYIYNKVNDNNSTSLMTETGIYFIPKSKKVSGSIFCYNIFNESNYIVQRTYPNLQSIINTPLIKRSFFLSVYVQL
jgi:hypothetical protein